MHYIHALMIMLYVSTQCDECDSGTGGVLGSEILTRVGAISVSVIVINL